LRTSISDANGSAESKERLGVEKLTDIVVGESGKRTKQLSHTPAHHLTVGAGPFSYPSLTYVLSTVPDIWESRRVPELPPLVRHHDCCCSSPRPSVFVVCHLVPPSQPNPPSGTTLRRLHMWSSHSLVNCGPSLLLSASGKDSEGKGIHGVDLVESRSNTEG